MDYEVIPKLRPLPSPVNESILSTSSNTPPNHSNMSYMLAAVSAIDIRRKAAISPSTEYCVNRNLDTSDEFVDLIPKRFHIVLEPIRRAA